MTLSNILTSLRIVLSFIFVWFLFKRTFLFDAMALIIFIIAAITDLLDGFFARIRNEKTLYGKVMDPIADKVLILFAFGSFSFLGMIPWWIFAIVCFREVLVTGIRIVFFKGNGKVLEASFKGKQKTFFQLSTVILIMVGLLVRDYYTSGYYPFGFMRNYNIVVSVFLGAMVGLTILSAIDIIARSRNMVKK